MEPEAVRILKWVYLIVFLVAGSIVTILTVSSGSLFEPVRFSNVVSLNAAGSQIAAVFRFLVAFYLFLIFVDTVSLFNYKSLALREISSLVSLVGFFLMGVASLFMVYILAASSGAVGTTTVVAMLYLVISVGLFLLDLLTFFIDEQELMGLALKKRKSHRGS